MGRPPRGRRRPFFRVVYSTHYRSREDGNAECTHVTRQGYIHIHDASPRSAWEKPLLLPYMFYSAFSFRDLFFAHPAFAAVSTATVSKLFRYVSVILRLEWLSDFEIV